MTRGFSMGCTEIHTQVILTRYVRHRLLYCSTADSALENHYGCSFRTILLFISTLISFRVDTGHVSMNSHTMAKGNWSNIGFYNECIIASHARCFPVSQAVCRPGRLRAAWVEFLTKDGGYTRGRWSMSSPLCVLFQCTANTQREIERL